jgi:glycosyltransferase involved in cell wall biosynthesis
MQAISGLFDATTLAIVETPPLSGGIALPRSARVALTPPQGPGGAAACVLRLPAYGREISRAMEADVVHTLLPETSSTWGCSSRWLEQARDCALRRVLARTSQTTLMNRATRATMRLLAGIHVMLATGNERLPSPGTTGFASASRAEPERVRVDFDRGWSRPPRLVFVGRLSSEKGLSFLFEALEGIRTEGRAPMPVLTLVGEGPERPRLEAHVRRAGLESAVRFVGQQNREGLSRELQLGPRVQPSSA